MFEGLYLILEVHHDSLLQWFFQVGFEKARCNKMVEKKYENVKRRVTIFSILFYVTIYYILVCKCLRNFWNILLIMNKIILHSAI